jgi:predicted deacylase
MAGVLAWRVRPGDRVTEGQLMGEVVNMEDVDAPRVPLLSRTAGLVYGMRRHKLAVPGDVVLKVAGSSALPWRKGDLLTA